MFLLIVDLPEALEGLNCPFYFLKTVYALAQLPELIVAQLKFF